MVDVVAAQGIVRIASATHPTDHQCGLSDTLQSCFSEFSDAYLVWIRVVLWPGYRAAQPSRFTLAGRVGLARGSRSENNNLRYSVCDANTLVECANELT